MPVEDAETAPVRSVRYELEIRIEAPRTDVWRALVDETPEWWLPEFRMARGSRGAVLEAVAGGRLYEEGDGTGLLWYVVVEVVPTERLALVGDINPRYGGPARSHLELVLEERDGATVLRVTDAIYGAVSDDLVGSLSDGWRWLFTDGLKAHAERD